MDSLTCLPITQNKKKLYSRGCVIVCASSISGEKFPPLLKYSTREQGQWISHEPLFFVLFFSIESHTCNAVYLDGFCHPTLKIRKMWNTPRGLYCHQTALNSANAITVPRIINLYTRYLIIAAHLSRSIYISRITR